MEIFTEMVIRLNRYFCPVKLKAGPFPSLGVVYLSADVVDEACLF